MLDPRQRYLRSVLGQDVDRPPFVLPWGPWASTWQRWQAESLPKGVVTWSDLCQRLGNEDLRATLDVHCGPCPAVPYQVFHEDDSSIEFLDNWGIRKRNLKTGVSMPAFLDFPIHGREDWEHYKRHHLDPHHPDRLAGNWREQAAVAMAAGHLVQLGRYPDSGLFGSLRWMVGDEEACLIFYDDPELAHDILTHFCDIYLHVYEQVLSSGARVDIIHLWEDCCGKQGPLIGPDMWREFISPHYQRIRDLAERYHVPVLSVDSDGDPALLIPEWVDCGINLLFPMEVAAGADVASARNSHPELSLLGGIDKRALATSKAAIDTELGRIAELLPLGQFIPGLDHLIPDDVSIEHFIYYAEHHRRLLDDVFLPA